MKSSTTTTLPPKSFILRSFLFSISLSLILLFLFLSLPPKPPIININTSIVTNSSDTPSGIRIRPGYASYDAYIQRQLNKTLNPKLRQIWTTRDWDRKVHVFSHFFSRLQQDRLLSNSSKSLCVGARVGQEVAALRNVGVKDAVGIDLVPYPPLVIKGDFHNQPFANETFDFEFSNVFDHALFPDKFVGEIERTLRPGGVCVLHVAISRRSDKYSANDLFSVRPLKEMFKGSEMVRVRKVDGFGLDTEVVFRKKKKKVKDKDRGRKQLRSFRF